MHSLFARGFVAQPSFPYFKKSSGVAPPRFFGKDDFLGQSCILGVLRCSPYLKC